MKFGRAAISLGLITFLYLIVLVWLDSQNRMFDRFAELAGILVILMGFSVMSYCLRYGRWYWMLRRVGHDIPIWRGFAAYLSGFAFTATPGKVGELVRIRYLSPMGVKPARTLAAFVFERAFDLLAVLLLAALFISRVDIFIFVFSFVLLFLSAIVVMSLRPKGMTRLVIYLRVMEAKRLSRLVRTLRNGLVGCRSWANPIDFLVSFLLGFCAWGLTSLSFVYLLNQFGASIPLLISISIYPIAMLAGAASMIPGGFGSTEATIIALLSSSGMTLDVKALAAIGIRLSTLWFSIIIGCAAIVILEWRGIFGNSDNGISGSLASRSQCCSQEASMTKERERTT